jgi:hypothetical protein
LQSNFIAIDLTCVGDPEDTNGRSFMIGEYDNKYAAVAGNPKLAQYPEGGD